MGMQLSFPLLEYWGVKWWGGLGNIYLTFGEIAKLFSKVVVSFCTFNSKALKLQLLYILTKVWGESFQFYLFKRISFNFLFNRNFHDLMILNIFSYTFWSFVYLLLWNVQSNFAKFYSFFPLISIVNTSKYILVTSSLLNIYTQNTGDYHLDCG